MKRLVLFVSIWICISYVLNANDVNGKILEQKNITIIKVWGTHHERGLAYGYLLGRQISSFYNSYKKVVCDKKIAKLKRLYSNGKLRLKYEDDYVIEAKAMVEGMNRSNTNIHNLDYLDLLFINSLIDIKSLKSLPKLNGFACSALMSWGKATKNTELDGKSVVSRHFDWFNAEGIVKNQIIIIHIPSELDEQPWLSIGFAGIIGVVSGINKSGVTVFQNSLPLAGGKGKNDIWYEPIVFASRKGLESVDYNGDNHNDVLDIKSALLSNENGYAEGALIYSMGPATNRNNERIAFVAELTPDAPHFTFRNTEFKDEIPGENLYVANNLLKKKARKIHGRRNKDVVKVFNRVYPNGENIDVEANWNILRDYSQFHVIANIETNIQCMQFVPEQMLLKLSVSNDKTPAYTIPPVVYDLKLLF